MSLFLTGSRLMHVPGVKHGFQISMTRLPLCGFQGHQRGLSAVTEAVSPAASAYVHLPFCKRRCYYCDFPIQVVGSDSDSRGVQDNVAAYVDAVCAELDATGHRAKGLQTVYFGGGTPSLTHPKEMERLLEKMDGICGINSEAEISMEIDPGTFTAAKLKEYKRLGINRFSVGIQAFSDRNLKDCGRSHGLQQVYEALESIVAVSPSSWSLDLISGLPNVDLQGWEYTLEEAINANPDHIAVYDLQIEKSTPFYRWFSPGCSALPSSDEAAEMYELASKKLRRAGFEHYEISNYAKKNHRCAHNMMYWSMKPFHAFGLGAASYLDGKRFHRPKKMRDYLGWVDKLSSMGGAFDTQVQEQEESDRLLETIMLRLRVKDGLNLVELEERFGSGMRDKVLLGIERFLGGGFVEKIGHEGDVLTSREWGDVESIRLSDPKGFLIANDVISEVFSKV